MTQTLTDRISFIEQAERGLSDLEPGTEAWRNAERVVVQARAGYWTAMRQDWDLNHPPRRDDGDGPAPVVDAPRGRTAWR